MLRLTGDTLNPLPRFASIYRGIAELPIPTMARRPRLESGGPERWDLGTRRFSPVDLASPHASVRGTLSLARRPCPVHFAA